uniref:Transglutaminase-like domain-containing protein n=1 Tax=Eptatretus burgeri TaxID=7764 RepID=A0A8C4NB97_EPTBU
MQYLLCNYNHHFTCTSLIVHGKCMLSHNILIIIIIIHQSCHHTTICCFSAADVVYMRGDEEKKEYVLNDGGCIFYGSQNQIFSRPWNYGQFEKPILDATLLLLQSTENRGDAINVVRTISALVNATDEGGVLIGNWGSTFSDGISPMAWNGSVEILRKFYKTRNSVKYGQCWVFAGVVTTVLRSLGIPCRTISNFSSAHDTDKNVTIDTFVDESFNVLNSLSSDSIW